MFAFDKFPLSSPHTLSLSTLWLDAPALPLHLSLISYQSCIPWLPPLALPASAQHAAVERPAPEETVTASFGRFISGLKAQHLTPTVLCRSKRMVLDSLGVGLLGSTTDVFQLALRHCQVRSSENWGRRPHRRDERHDLREQVANVISCFMCDCMILAAFLCGELKDRPRSTQTDNGHGIGGLG